MALHCCNNQTLVSCYNFNAALVAKFCLAVRSYGSWILNFCCGILWILEFEILICRGIPMISDLEGLFCRGIL